MNECDKLTRFYARRRARPGSLATYGMEKRWPPGLNSSMGEGDRLGRKLGSKSLTWLGARSGAEKPQTPSTRSGPPGRQATRQVVANERTRKPRKVCPQ